MTINNPKNATIEAIEIYNVVGQMVLINSTNENTIDVSNLESGTYFIKIYSENSTETAKFVKN